ncbi:MAG: VanZ family protein [Flavobacteriales bacterium]|nr:VanZ family protein [Flavobacteriales bacterium]
MSQTFRIVLAVLWTAFIIYGLTAAPSEHPRFPWLALEGMDKLIHVLLFAVEASLVALALSNENANRTVILALLWCSILGGSLELLQHYFVEGRSGDVFDLLADMIGSVLAIGIKSIFEKR